MKTKNPLVTFTILALTKLFSINGIFTKAVVTEKIATFASNMKGA
jgi:hypothetical protein